MTPGPRTHFTTLTEAEKKSKLWQLSNKKGKCTIWLRGSKSRVVYRTKDFIKETSKLVLHEESQSPQLGQEVLGTFELNNVSFFFKAKVAVHSSEEFVVEVTGDCYKSERRQNFRLLTYPIYDITAMFKLPAGYEGGKIIDIKNRVSQTGLFKSFLKLVDPAGESSTKGDSVKLRIQDLSVTGMSVHIGLAELEWFRAGETIQNVEVMLEGEKIMIPACRIVYVVDHIGHSDKHIKKFKVGIRFDSMPKDLDDLLGAKINELLRAVDANKDFEDFLK